MTYKEILSSDYFFNTYAKIEHEKRNYPVNHGFVHVWSVINWAKKLAQIFNLSEKETSLLLIASALHDIGYIKGREGHAQNGSILAEEFLKEKLNNEDCKIVCEAIANHGGKTISAYDDNISMCLILADKFNFEKTRYREDENHQSIKMFLSIEKNELIKNGNEYDFIIYSNDISLFDDMDNNYYFKKLKNALGLLYDARQIRINIKIVSVNN